VTVSQYLSLLLLASTASLPVLAVRYWMSQSKDTALANTFLFGSAMAVAGAAFPALYHFGVLIR
jgi:hypothetical protein